MVHKISQTPLFVAFFRDFSMVKYSRENSFFQNKNQTPKFKSEISQGSFFRVFKCSEGHFNIYIYIPSTKTNISPFKSSFKDEV